MMFFSWSVPGIALAVGILGIQIVQAAASAEAEEACSTNGNHSSLAAGLLQVGFRSKQGQVNDATCSRFRLHGYPPLVSRLNRPKPRLYDLFYYAFNGELPVLELRLAEMASEVDEIFVVESDRDFLGNPRQLEFRQLLTRPELKPYADKVTVIEVSPTSQVVGEHKFDIQAEIVQMVEVARNEILSRVGANPNFDLLLQSDLDELVSRHTLQTLRHCQPEGQEWPGMMPDMNLYYINFGWRDTNGWPLGTIVSLAADENFTWKPTGKPLPPHHIARAPSAKLSLLSLSNDIRRNTDSSHRSRVVSSSAGIHHVNLKLESQYDQPSGWHMSWSLDAPSIAQKLYTRPEGVPRWAQGLSGSALVELARQKIVAGPKELIGADCVKVDELEKLPEALTSDPDHFRQLLSDSQYLKLKAASKPN